MESSTLLPSTHPGASYTTCKAFQLQPAPRPKGGLRKQTSKDSSFSKTSLKTADSTRKMDRGTTSTTNLLLPADFRETTASPDATRKHQDEPLLPIVKVEQRIVDIPEYEEVPLDPRPDQCASIKPVSSAQAARRWPGALPYCTSGSASEDDTSNGRPQFTGLNEPVSTSHPGDQHQQGRKSHQVRGDGWGGLRAPSSWFGTTFVPGPLVTPTPSVNDLLEYGKQDNEGSARRVALLIPSKVRRSLKSKGTGAIASIANAEVPPLPGVPSRSFGTKGTARDDREETHVQWSEYYDGRKRYGHGYAAALGGLPTSPTSPLATTSSPQIRYKGQGAPMSTALDFTDRPEGAVRDPEDDDGWKDRLVAAVQAAIRHTATAASDARASVLSVASRSKARQGRRQPIDGSLNEAQAYSRRADAELLDVRTDAERSQAENGTPFNGKAATMVVYGSDWVEGQPVKTEARPSQQPNHRSLLPGSLAHKTTRKEKWRHMVLVALLLFLLLALLSNLIVLNIKVLSPTSSERSSVPSRGEDTILSTPASASTGSGPSSSSKSDSLGSVRPTSSSDVTSTTAPLEGVTYGPVSGPSISKAPVTTATPQTGQALSPNVVPSSLATTTTPSNVVEPAPVAAAGDQTSPNEIV